MHDLYTYERGGKLSGLSSRNIFFLLIVNAKVYRIICLLDQNSTEIES